MASKGLVDGLNITLDPLLGKCEDCILARQTCCLFNEPSDPNVDPLDLVATDLWGPSRTASVSGKTYLMILIDSETGYKDGEFLTDKSDDTTMAAFDKWRKLAEMQTGKNVKHVKADHAFARTKWVDYCAKHGIILELTAPHSSTQNGLAERAICMTMEDTRVLLSDSGLADCYWAEAAAMSIFTQNLTPSRRHPGKIPAEAFTKHTECGVPPSKLEPPSKKCVFLGYAGSNYRVLNQSGRVFMLRDVIFDEGIAHRSVAMGETELEPTSMPSSTPVAPAATMTPAAAEPTMSDIPEEPTLHRSSWLTCPSPNATESIMSAQHEAEACLKDDEWATNSRQPHASMAASEAKPDPYIPKNYRDALKVNEKRWKAAMDMEYNMHLQKHTWDLVNAPEGANIMDCKWVYGMKWDGDSNWLHDKARLVGKGYTQQYGLDYNDTWAVVTHLESVRMSAAVAMKLDLHLWQVDFISTYLNSEMKEDIYMCQPPGYVVEGQEDKVCKLVHTIYGTMQGGHDWYETLGKTYDDLGYRTSHADPCVRTIGASLNKEEVSHRKGELEEKWDLTDVGENHYFLGMRIDQDLEAGMISFSQHPYWENVFSDFNLTHLTPRSTLLPVGIILNHSQSPTMQAE
ncbi:uncharacterized protein ARMOST_01564 [Armillaria ostoyae]|uniref:Integrase catalytic domain-containing protein n=1 Tax=Armillaria ostoyae TaxID=47428 RepID=A0A284QP85_ARMOS|nr:uncharacterized protein ARMOST_01564 [Armillaria ostoyae]